MVTSIADNASSYIDHKDNENVYKEIVSITIPDSVTEIGHFAFYCCESLIKVIIPDSVVKIGYSAFYSCRKLESVIIPSKVTIISSGTFKSSGLKSIIIPNSVTKIEEEAFEFCNNLEKMSIPDTVYSIGAGALSSCKNLTEIVVSARNQNYCIFGDVLFDKEKHTLICYPAGKKDTEYSIPYGVTKIEDSAFRGCSLTHIEIPNSVFSIGDRAFSECRKLIDVNIPNSVNSIGYRAFDDTEEITLTHNVEHIGEYAFETLWKQKGLCTCCGSEYNAFRKCKSCGRKK